MLTPLGSVSLPDVVNTRPGRCLALLGLVLAVNFLALNVETVIVLVSVDVRPMLSVAMAISVSLPTSESLALNAHL